MKLQTEDIKHFTKDEHLVISLRIFDLGKDVYIYIQNDKFIIVIFIYYFNFAVFIYIFIVLNLKKER